MTWPAVRLSHLAELIRGVTFAQGDASQSGAPGLVPVLRAGNIQNRLVTDDDLVWIPSDLVAQDQYLRLGDVVVCTSSGSASIVGKSAILDHEFHGTWGAFNAVIRSNTELLLPHFLNYWLRSPDFNAWKARQVQGANIKNIRHSELASATMPLPPLPEQQRIVELLRAAEGLAQAKQSIIFTINRLIRALYWEHFEDLYTAEGIRNPARIAKLVADVQYGVSESMAESGSHAVLRMNSISPSGWLDLSDLKYADLSTKDAAGTELRDGDILFNRTNSRELVGKCAIWRDRPGRFSFASYLVRLRLKNDLTPEYLWATLNSDYGKYSLLGAAKQSVSMANISPTDLGRIIIPRPSQQQQQRFARQVRDIEAMRARVLSTVGRFQALCEAVSHEAFSGQLTAVWREQHRAELEAAARRRDVQLGLTPSNLAARDTRYAANGPLIDFSRPGRHAVFEALSTFQQEVWNMLCLEGRRVVLADDPAACEEFCTNAQTGWRIERFRASTNEVRRTLEQLAALGLLAKVSLPQDDPETGRTHYLTAFRPLRADEDTRLSDATQLARELGSSSEGHA